MRRKYAHSSSEDQRHDIITIGVYMSDYMKENVKYFATLIRYDMCLHGHNMFMSTSECGCPIGKSYTAIGEFKAHHICPSAEGGDIKIPRWKALEIISDWNRNHALECKKNNRPVRWFYFLPDQDPSVEELKTYDKDLFNHWIVPNKHEL